MAGNGQANNDGGHTKKKAGHFVFVPLMSQGHVIPVVDLAMLVASHGAVSTIVCAPGMAAQLRPAIHSAQQSGLPVRLADFPVDYAKAGLPDGMEDVASVPPMHMLSYFQAMALLRAPVEEFLREQSSPYPTCVVSDFCQPWTSELAANLRVPRLVFISQGAIFRLCQLNIERFGAYDGVEDEHQPVAVPGLELADGTRIEVTRAQAPPLFGAPGWERLAADIERAQAEADGIMLNSFLELEPEFVAGYAAARGTKVWTVGPVSLYHQQQTTLLAARGKDAADAGVRCLRWLDGRSPGSVVLVCLGSMLQPSARQAVELGLGLEASGHPFIWVLLDAGKYDEATRAFLRELEARVAGRGLLVSGWAPQVLLLAHAALGGFVTHCGWNSMLEAVAAGLPVVTWPNCPTDLFVNEKLAVEVLGIGVSVGLKEPTAYRTDGKEIVVARDVVETAVRSVMDGGEEGKERRRRATALAAKARAATLEGGSSHANLLEVLNRFQGN